MKCLSKANRIKGSPVHRHYSRTKNRLKDHDNTYYHHKRRGTERSGGEHSFPFTTDLQMYEGHLWVVMELCFKSRAGRKKLKHYSSR